MPIPGQNRLSVVMDQRKVQILERTELKQEPVIFVDTKLLPLIGINVVDKTAAGVKWDFLQERDKGMGIRYRHTTSI